jgi:tRNA nucleotidyltransferase (CCA-adding enzyme)
MIPADMTRKLTPPLPDLAQTHPGLGILRMAALLAEDKPDVDEEALDLMFEQVDAGLLLDTVPAEIWPELARGLMARSPSKMVKTLRECGALEHILPEVAALFGVPQITDDPTPVDLGEHLYKALDEAARRGAPLAVRFALLAMNVGKADSPPEHLPVHYRHIERGRPRIKAICARFETPEDCRELALLALAECERVHRASKTRAGPVAQMLERVGAFRSPDFYHLFLTVCACDYCANGDRSGADYPKADLLNAALAACAGIDGLAHDEAVQTARAEAIARVFNSQRWSDGAV